MGAALSENSNQSVSLGCGTLILIAVIVMIFSNNRSDLDNQINGLRSDMNALTVEIRTLRQTLTIQKQAEAPLQQIPVESNLETE